jgi:hypothetical protein
MKLAGDEKRMRVFCEFNHFDEFSVGRNAAENESFFFENGAIFRVEFVTMSVSFKNFLLAVINLTRQTLLFQPASPSAETHRAAEFFDIY